LLAVKSVASVVNGLHIFVVRERSALLLSLGFVAEDGKKQTTAAAP
jgi:hypothetical protein